MATLITGILILLGLVVVCYLTASLIIMSIPSFIMYWREAKEVIWGEK